MSLVKAAPAVGPSVSPDPPMSWRNKQKAPAWFQELTVVRKLLLLLYVGFVAWLLVGTAHFGLFKASGGRPYIGVGIAAGVALVFIPCVGELRPTGRVIFTVIPAIELATIIHAGSHREVDRAYGALAAYVARHALAVDGPIREYYLVGSQDTPDEAAWRTEIGWPIFRTAPSG